MERAAVSGKLENIGLDINSDVLKDINLLENNHNSLFNYQNKTKAKNDFNTFMQTKIFKWLLNLLKENEDYTHKNLGGLLLSFMMHLWMIRLLQEVE